MFFSPRSKLNKILSLTILVLFLFVVNNAVWQEIAFAQEKKEMAEKAAIATTITGGVCAARTAVALWQAPKEAAECLNEVIIALWKTIVFPMIKRAAMNLITKGDFGITWEGIRDWFYKDLIFQTAEQVINAMGFSLCAHLSIQLKLALYRSFAPLGEGPECTFNQSEFAKIIEDFIRHPEAGAQRIRRDFFSSFYFQATDNQFVNWFDIRQNIISETRKKQDDLKFELMINNGFLGKRGNCEDRDGDGIIDKTNECQIVTPGLWIAERLIGEQKALEEATWQAQSAADLGVLTAEMLDLLINQAISGFFNDVKGWFSSQSEEASRDYIKALEKEARENQLPTGENKSIEFPHQPSGYNLEGVSPTTATSPSPTVSPIPEEPGTVTP